MLGCPGWDEVLRTSTKCHAFWGSTRSSKNTVQWRGREVKDQKGYKMESNRDQDIWRMHCEVVLKITHLIRFINADSQVIAGVVVLPIWSQQDLDTKDSKEEEKKPAAALGTTWHDKLSQLARKGEVSVFSLKISAYQLQRIPTPGGGGKYVPPAKLKAMEEEVRLLGHWCRFPQIFSTLKYYRSSFRYFFSKKFKWTRESGDWWPETERDHLLEILFAGSLFLTGGFLSYSLL